MAHEATIPTTSPTTEAFVTTLVPGGYARFVRQTPSDALDAWFQYIQDEWRELRGEKVSPGFESFVARTAADPLFVSPVPWSYPYTREIGFVSPMHALWCSLPIARDGESSGFYRISAESEASVRHRLTSQRPPSAILFEGARLTGFWFVKDPVNATEARRSLHQIAARFDCVRGSQCEPELALVAVPGTKPLGLIPSRPLSLDVWHPERIYSADEIRGWIEGS